MAITWGQYYNGFTEEEIEKARYNTIKITEKIIDLHNKVNTDNRNKILEVIDRLQMSKDCIDFYYGL